MKGSRIQFEVWVCCCYFFLNSLTLNSQVTRMLHALKILVSQEFIVQREFALEFKEYS